MVKIVEVYEEEPDACNAFGQLNVLLAEQSGFFVEWRNITSFIHSLLTICQQRDLDILFDSVINLQIENIYDADGISELMEVVH